MPKIRRRVISRGKYFVGVWRAPRRRAQAGSGRPHQAVLFEELCAFLPSESMLAGFSTSRAAQSRRGRTAGKRAALGDARAGLAHRCSALLSSVVLGDEPVQNVARGDAEGARGRL